ncbi:hypothetical protein ACI48J_15090 [Paenibacillus chitinolyticus]|uniref:hypothetical protein n=1 Tax=Paenibacillus chitinolyticus TaxID=79263 RepID=UPI00386BF111
MHLFADKPEEMDKEIQRKIRIETGVHVRVGIGENKTLLKLCCDMIAKNELGIRVMGAVVLVGCMGAGWDHPTGFHRQMKMPDSNFCRSS